MADEDRRLEALLAAGARGKRLREAEALLLAEKAELPLLGLAASERSRACGGAVGFVPDVTIIYSAACAPGCPYCPGTPPALDSQQGVLAPEEVQDRVERAAAGGAVQVVLQGGHRPDIPWQVALDLVRASSVPARDMHVVAFSVTELLVWSRQMSQKPVERLAGELLLAGASTLPGGALDALQEVRRGETRRLLQGPWPEWEETILGAARAGLRVVATLPVGVDESPAERARYLLRLRSLQDRLLDMGTTGFTSLVILPAGRDTSGYEYLKAVALARLVVDNIPHVQATFLFLGAKVAQVALGGGADDIGGTHLEAHHISLAAGREGPMTQEEVMRLIRDAGAQPVLRRLGEA